MCQPCNVCSGCCSAGAHLLPQLGEVERAGWEVGVVVPRRLVPDLGLVHPGGVDRARRELHDALAAVEAGGRVHRLELGGEVHRAVLRPAHVQRVDADRVAPRDVDVGLGVVEHEREDAVQVLADLRRRLGRRAELLVQRDDDLAVGAGGEVGALEHAGLEREVVVDLAVDRQGDRAVLAEQRLLPGLRVHNGKPLMRDRVRAHHLRAAPVRAAVAHLGGGRARLLAQGVLALRRAEDREDAAHDCDSAPLGRARL